MCHKVIITMGIGFERQRKGSLRERGGTKGSGMGRLVFARPYASDIHG